MLRNAGGGGYQLFCEKMLRRFNVISVTRGWVGGGPISRKKALRNTSMVLKAKI